MLIRMTHYETQKNGIVEQRGIMKNLYLVLIVLLFMSIHNHFEKHESRTPASMPNDSEAFSQFKKGNSFIFLYSYKGKELKVEKESSDSIVAFKEAASSCFKYFASKEPNLKENSLLIIDTCSNPR